MNFGEILRNTREEKKLSIQAVSDAIHLSVTQISALETHQFSDLPEPMITRGFIRNYAKFLGVSHEPLIENYRELVPNDVSDSLVVNASVNQVYSENKQRPWLVYILGSILILLFLMVWLNYIDHVPSEDTDKAPQDVLEEVEVSAPNEAGGYVPQHEVSVAQTPVVEAAEPIVQDADKIAKADQATPITPVTTALENNSQDLQNDQPSSTDASQATASFDTNAIDALSLTFTDESWLSIRDGSGRVVFQKLMTAGSSKQLNITKPFSLTIGNANTVSASYAGEMINLANVSRSNVARVKME